MTVKDSATTQAVFGLNSNLLGNDSLHVESGGTGSILNLTVDGVAFNGARGDQLQTIAIGVTNQTITITNNQFLNGHGNIVSGGGGLDLLGGSTAVTSNATINFNVSNNTIKGALGNAIDAIYTGHAATINGVILNNQIGTNNGALDTNANRGSDGGAGIDLGHAKSNGAGSINFAVRIESNDIYDINNGLSAIRLVANSAGGGSSRLEATVKDNNNGDVGGSNMASRPLRDRRRPGRQRSLRDGPVRHRKHLPRRHRKRRQQRHLARPDFDQHHRALQYSRLQSCRDGRPRRVPQRRRRRAPPSRTFCERYQYADQRHLPGSAGQGRRGQCLRDHQRRLQPGRADDAGAGRGRGLAGSRRQPGHRAAALPGRAGRSGHARRRRRLGIERRHRLDRQRRRRRRRRRRHLRRPRRLRPPRRPTLS